MTSATAHGSAAVSNGRNCITRCMAVPRSAPVSPRFSCKNRGRSGALSLWRGSVPSAISSSMARPFSWVAVTLEGVTVAALCPYTNPSDAVSGVVSGDSPASSSAGDAAPSVSSPPMRCRCTVTPAGASVSSEGRTPAKPCSSDA